MIRLLAGDFRDEVEASRARMSAVIAVLNHPGHDQSSHGRKGDSVERARERQAQVGHVVAGEVAGERLLDPEPCRERDRGRAGERRRLGREEREQDRAHPPSSLARRSASPPEKLTNHRSRTRHAAAVASR